MMNNKGGDALSTFLTQVIIDSCDMRLRPSTIKKGEYDPETGEELVPPVYGSPVVLDLSHEMFRSDQEVVIPLRDLLDPLCSDDLDVVMDNYQDSDELLDHADVMGDELIALGTELKNLRDKFGLRNREEREEEDEVGFDEMLEAARSCQIEGDELEKYLGIAVGGLEAVVAAYPPDVFRNTPEKGMRMLALYRRSVALSALLNHPNMAPWVLTMEGIEAAQINRAVFRAAAICKLDKMAMAFDPDTFFALVEAEAEKDGPDIMKALFDALEEEESQDAADNDND